MSIVEPEVIPEEKVDPETKPKHYPVHWIAAGTRKEVAFCSQKKERKMSHKLLEVTCFDCITLIANK